MTMILKGLRPHLRGHTPPRVTGHDKRGRAITKSEGLWAYRDDLYAADDATAHDLVCEGHATPARLTGTQLALVSAVLRPEICTASDAAKAALSIRGVKVLRAVRSLGGCWEPTPVAGLGVTRGLWEGALTAREVAALADRAPVIFRFQNAHRCPVALAWAEPGILSPAPIEVSIIGR